MVHHIRLERNVRLVSSDTSLYPATPITPWVRVRPVVAGWRLAQLVLGLPASCGHRQKVRLGFPLVLA